MFLSATIKRQNGTRDTVREYVSPEDVVWLHRAVEAEGPHEERVAQALVAGWLEARARGYKRSLGDYVQAYAQPINPRWFPTGDLFLKKHRSQAETKKAERRRDVHAKRTKFDRKTQRAVALAIGQPSSSVATDYAASWVDASPRLVPVSQSEPGTNRTWRKPDVYSVEWVPSSSSTLPALLALGLAVIALRIAR